MNVSDTHFSLFGLPEDFEVNEDALNAAYRTVQSQAHPDRYAHAGDAERRVAMQWATRANEAYQTLRDPLKRATYLLHLKGIDVQAENNTAMPPAFLLQQMEWRESLGDAKAARDVDALDALLGMLRKEKRVRYAALAGLLNGDGNSVAAADAVRQLMFIEKIERDTAEAIDRLDD
ncbi:Fe-S protein assembly co-chaperone HscB [Ralstonia flaminis]|jgi:molecular chaperone HscB|uniref:Co-chaperone protein HscB homolog n=1 Tax=Ralstonia flaminis TaxID=3058597 RepID=A0ABM9K7J7_9RALS|nr:Fe-S protein assembly co-chaperone HscB [Ralstonia sp. LMG 18101]CAJ0818537.1 Co-chaperone protein HscB [Ralstonia sp. LMG 18101]